MLFPTPFAGVETPPIRDGLQVVAVAQKSLPDSVLILMLYLQVQPCQPPSFTHRSPRGGLLERRGLQSVQMSRAGMSANVQAERMTALRRHPVPNAQAEVFR